MMLTTTATTPAGIARAYVRQHGRDVEIGFGRREPTRDHRATQEADGTWTIWGCTGSRSEPRGAVRLATGVVVAQ